MYRESRPLDHVYDPLFTTSTGRRRGPVRSKASHAKAVAKDPIFGADRYKFFKRPIVPYMPAVPSHTLLAPMPRDRAQQQSLASPHPQDPSAEADDAVGGVRTVGVQTLYRESAAQTDPYTPPIKPLPPDSEPPEVLALQHLKWKRGLPAKLEEVHMIQRIREKRAFEASLPPLTDQASFETRRKLMEAQELKEWELREEEMKREHESRLAMLVQRLQEREQKHDNFLQKRIEKLRAEKMAKKEKLMASMRRKRVKVARGVQRARKTKERGPEKRDVVDEYSNQGSKVYAPVTRQGRVPMRTQVEDYSIAAVQSYHELQQLEQRFPKRTIEPVVQRPKKTDKSRSAHKAQALGAHLEFAQRMLKENKSHQAGDLPVENVYKKFEPLVRPPTPTVDTSGHGKIQRAAVLVQRLLRGRSEQNLMLEGKENFLSLIRELQLSQQASDKKDTHEQEEAEEEVDDDDDEEEEKKKPRRLQVGREELRSRLKDALAGYMLSSVLTQEAHASRMRKEDQLASQAELKSTRDQVTQTLLNNILPAVSAELERRLKEAVARPPLPCRYMVTVHVVEAKEVDSSLSNVSVEVGVGDQPAQATNVMDLSGAAVEWREEFSFNIPDNGGGLPNAVELDLCTGPPSSAGGPSVVAASGMLELPSEVSADGLYKDQWVAVYDTNHQPSGSVRVEVTVKDMML